MTTAAGTLNGVATSSSRDTHLLPRATIGESLGILASVVAPTLAKGVIIRRRWAVALAERFDLDARAVRCMQRLSDAGRGPLLLGPVRRRYWSIVLAPEHVRRVLEGSPRPFATATAEKIKALSHFEPRGVLISQGAERAERRAFNERVLDTERPLHRLAAPFVAVVRDEIGRLMAEADARGTLSWSQFAPAWFRIVRRVAFGGGAGGDAAFTALLDRLRAYANWAGLWPMPERLRDRYFARLQQHLARAEPGSLAAMMAAAPTTAATAAADQVGQWLFASDPAGMATFRTLALLATHPAHAERVREELRGRDPAAEPLPYLRACVLESLRLWPTAPMVLRQTVEETEWEEGVMPAQTGVLIFAPFFHRDERRLPFAHRLAPEVWLRSTPAEDWPLLPFSAGPARCPGRHLVELLSTATLAALLDGRALRLSRPDRLDPDRPLPGTLNHFRLRFVVHRPAGS